jgi:hypothetical protein
MSSFSLAALWLSAACARAAIATKAARKATECIDCRMVFMISVLIGRLCLGGCDDSWLLTHKYTAETNVDARSSPLENL